jgi:hypothetical protein
MPAWPQPPCASIASALQSQVEPIVVMSSSVMPHSLCSSSSSGWGSLDHAEHDSHGNESAFPSLACDLYDCDQLLCDSNGELLTECCDGRGPGDGPLHSLVVSAPLVSDCAIAYSGGNEVAACGLAGTPDEATSSRQSRPAVSKALMFTADDCLFDFAKVVVASAACDSTMRLALLPPPGATADSLPHVVKASSLYVRGLPSGQFNLLVAMP